MVITGGGIALSVLGDVIIFWWVLVQMPRLEVSRAVALRGVILAAVGFEVLKLIGTYTIAKSSHSPTLGPFAGLLAVLIWIRTRVAVPALLRGLDDHRRAVAVSGAPGPSGPSGPSGGFGGRGRRARSTGH